MAITVAEHVRRRKRVLKAIGRDALAVVAAAPVRLRNNDVEYAYRPDSDFFYLTGFAEPDAVLVLVPGRKQGQVVMFCRKRDPALERWNGPRLGPEGVCGRLAIDEAWDIEELDSRLPALLSGRKRLYAMFGKDHEFDRRLFSHVRRLREKSRHGVVAPTEYFELGQVVHPMRQVKSSAELRLMRQAVRISAEAHLLAMKKTRPGRMEYEIESELLHTFRSHQAETAYASIVGSGENSCVLHYTANRRQMQDGDLLLIDAGAESGYYAADITRTFPVNGRFTAAQRAVYQVVLNAQQAAIRQVRPGNAWSAPHRAAVREITRGLVRLGLLKGEVRALIEDEAYKKFFMHGTGHWLGMDVHDVGDYKVDGKWCSFVPGMTLTVEPGIYIPPGNRKVARKWWNIGIRIEDDVLVTADGCEVLSRAVPKQIDEIEALVGTGAAG